MNCQRLPQVSKPESPLTKSKKKHEIRLPYLLKSGEAKNRIQVACILGVDRTLL